MPQFPEIDPETLYQAIRTFVTARMNSSPNGGTNYLSVVQGWADALAATQNPSNSFFNQNEQELFDLVAQVGGGEDLTFNTSAPISIGQFVYQLSNDTVALADNSSLSSGPAIGVVSAVVSPTSVRVKNVGYLNYNANMGFSFFPLTPDTIYYAGASGEITATPSAPSGGFNQVVGYAKTTTQFVLGIQAPIAV